MSGLEPLAVLGLACNVLQLVEVGKHTINLIKTVYQSASPDHTLEENAAILENATEEIRKCERPAKCPKHEQQLLVAADRCSAAARDLRQEIKFLVGCMRQGSLASTLKVVAKTNWCRRRFERLKESLDRTEKLMQTSLLTRVCSSTRSAELESKRIKRVLCEFIEKYCKGHRSTSDLVSRESMNIRNHISCVFSETNEAIGRVQTQLATLVMDSEIKVIQEKRKHLLDSLKYQGFNERRNQVSDVYENNGRWIFAGDGEGDIQDDAASNTDDTGSEANKSSQISRIYQTSRYELEWDSFSNWLRSTDTFYWINGEPRSGKSTFVKFVMDYPKTKKHLEV